MAGKTTNDILFRFLADTKSLERGTKRASKSMKKSQSGMGALTKAAGALGLALGAREVLQFAGDAVQLASAADEAASKFEAVFEGSVKAAESVKLFGDNAGVTEQQANDLFGTTGNLAQAMGFTVDESAALTDKIAILAGDMASFNDADPAAVFRDLNNGILTTEREGLKKFGISITEAEVKQRALNIAIKDGRSEVTKQDRSTASLAIATEQAGKAVGDLERTFDSTANKQRRVQKKFADLKVEIGRGLMPVFEELLGVVDGLADDLPRLATSIGKVQDAFSDVTGGADLFKFSLFGVVAQSIDMGKAVNEGLVQPFLEWGDAAVATEHDLRVLALSTRDLGDRIELTGIRTDAAKRAQGSWSEEAVEAQRKISGWIPPLEELNRQLALYHTNATNAEEAAIALRLALNPPTVGTGTGGGGIVGDTPFHSGGTVPGRGTQLAVVKGGETVVPTHPGGAGRGGGGSGVTVNVNFNGVVGDPVAVAEQIQDLIELYGRTNGVF